MDNENITENKTSVGIFGSKQIFIIKILVLNEKII